MPSRPDAYERQLANAKKRVKELPIPTTSRKAILDFTDYCFAEGLSLRRVIKYLYTLMNLARRLHRGFHKLTRADIEALIHGIERSDYSEWTKRDFRITLKKFFRWLRGTEEYPPEVKWLRSTLHNQRRKLPQELLTQDDVRRLIAAATCDRDKAFIAMLYESGCRIGELLSLRRKQLHGHPHGFRVTVQGAKGSRRLLLIASASYLTAWLNQHPRADDPQAPLWVSADYRAAPLNYATVSAIVKTTAKRAGISKRVNPHNFRHSRATHLATHLTEAQMKQYFGWVQSSDMAATYVHLSGRDIDNALLKLNHIQVSDERDNTDRFSVQSCPRCKLDNPPANRFCSRCGTVLDEETARKIVQRDLEHSRADEIMDRLIQDKEFREFVDRKLKKLGLAKR